MVVQQPSPPRTTPAPQSSPAYDVRVPPVVLLPQVVAVVATANDPSLARVTFVLAAMANLPIALAGRLPWWLERRSGLPVGDVAVAAARPVTALLYAGTLLVAAGPGAVAAHAAAWATVGAGALMLVLPGDWTPAGRLLQRRRRAGYAAAGELALFAARRASFGGLLAVPLLAAYAGVAIASAALVVAVFAGLVRPGRPRAVQRGSTGRSARDAIGR